MKTKVEGLKLGEKQSKSIARQGTGNQDAKIDEISRKLNTLKEKVDVIATLQSVSNTKSQSELLTKPSPK